MMHADRDALFCDLAETYHVFDWRALPAHTLAALSVGLRDDSRIKMKMAGMVYVSPVVLLTSIADNMTILRYWLTAKKGTPAPDLYTDIVTGKVARAEAARVEKENDKRYTAVRDDILADARARINEVISNG